MIVLRQHKEVNGIKEVRLFCDGVLEHHLTYSQSSSQFISSHLCMFKYKYVDGGFVRVWCMSCNDDAYSNHCVNELGCNTIFELFGC